MGGIAPHMRRARRKRGAMRVHGLRRVQLWLPDTRAPGFDEGCARQARLIRDSELSFRQADDVAWFAASDRTGWT